MSVAAGSCDQCKATGLPILPVRYTVVPDGLKPHLPSWAGGNRVKSVDIGPEFKYALRTVRTGFIYLFYEKHARGNRYWECYSVCQDGSLTLQPSPMAAKPYVGNRLLCARQTHVANAVHYLVIERPEQCGATWIAFSQDKWSDETLKEYTGNTKLRNARMQTIHPAQMIDGAKHAHGAVASKDTLEDVLEYAATVSTHVLPDASVTGVTGGMGGTGDISTSEDGSYNEPRLKQMSTRYPWALRQGAAEATAAHMKGRAKAAGGKPGTPHVLALWDAIGIAHELNGFRNDAAGWIKKYGDERELQIAAVSAIEGAKKALEKRAQSASDEQIARVRGMPDPMETRETRARIILKSNPGDADAQRELADVQSERQRRVVRSSQGAQDFKRNNIADAWPQYQARLGPSFGQFKRNWASFLDAADTVIDRRTVALVRWLEAPLLIDTLEDFHRSCAADGRLFEDAVGDAVFGMGSCKSGQTKIDEWVRQAKASVDTNLLWRAIALNQQEGVSEVDAALADIYSHPVPATQSAWDNTGGQVKWNKVFDLAKKSLTFYNTQMKAINDPASGIAKVESTRGLEKIYLTVGGSWFKPFAWTADTVNEMMLRTLLMVRSGAHPTAAKALATWDIANNASDRAELIRRLKNADYYLGQAAQAHYAEKARKWADLRTNADIPDAKKKNFNAARDARMALIVGVFEAFNLYKTSADAAKLPNSEKVQAQLTAAKYATASAAVDVLSNMAKGLASAGDKAVSYQVLKGLGGGLSVMASGYGASLDFGEVRRLWKGEDYRLGTMYLVRASFQAISAALTAATAFSYCSPLIETFGKRFGERLVGKVVLLTAERLALMRAALMLASLEVAIFVLAVAFVIWRFEDDALEKWCDRCAFGAKRKQLTDAYTDSAAQFNAYKDALKDVL